MGSEVIDTTSGMTANEQIAVFNQSSVVVALYEADVAYTIYRRVARPSVVELHADQFVSADMTDVSANYGSRITACPLHFKERISLPITITLTLDALLS